MTDDLVDRIYEAAFAPQNWLNVIEDLAKASGSTAGGILVLESDDAPRGMPLFRQGDIVGFLAAERLSEAMLNVAGFPSRPILRANRWFARRLQGYQGFIRSADVMTEEEMSGDPVQHALIAAGLNSETSLMTPTSNAEAVVVALFRRADESAHDEAAISALNVYGPHLSRASLISARLGLAWAERTVSALQAIGLPAAVLRGSGVVLATNEPFDQMHATFLPAAFGRITLVDKAAAAAFAEALESASTRRSDAVRSIPVAARDHAPAIIVHVIPIVRSAFDIFTGAEILVAATTIQANSSPPSPSLLTSLYNLTPAEARLAAALSSGQSLEAAAAAGQITVKSARTYLERIFAKTGTNRQSGLVALLRSVPPLAAVQEQ